jgi:hypothetical protein
MRSSTCIIKEDETNALSKENPLSNKDKLLSSSRSNKLLEFVVQKTAAILDVP